MASLGDWEKQQLKFIDWFFQKADRGIEKFKKNEKAINEDGKDEVDPSDLSIRTKFQKIVCCLYCMLDYTYFLLYYHFHNSEEPDNSKIR